MGASNRLPQRLVLHGFGAQLGLWAVPLQQTVKLLLLALTRFEPGQGVLAVGSGHFAHSVPPAAARGAQLPKQYRVLRAGFKRSLKLAQVARQARDFRRGHGRFAHEFLLFGFLTADGTCLPGGATGSMRSLLALPIA